MNEDFELLFFDTFAQTDGHEGPNLGLVQFPNPIIIKEIRVIPLGARVEANFPGGLRLGATIPSAFELEFFINDLTRGDACTFLDIGSLDYKQNVDIKFVPKENMIPTDGLIIRGMYSTLTLSVFGCIADISSIIANESVQSSNAITDPIPREQTSNDFVEELQTNRTEESVLINETLCERLDEMKVNQLIECLTGKQEQVIKKRRSPTVSRKHESRESRASSLSSDRSERKRKDKTVEPVSRSRHRSRDRNQRIRRSPPTSNTSKHRSRSRSKTKSKSRSTTPNSLKRYRYSHRTPSSPFDRSPKRHQNRSPHRQRSRSTSHSPINSKPIPRSPLSPPSRPLSRSRNRSLTKSPILLPIYNRNDLNENNGSVKLEMKPIVDNSAFDDSELFEPLSPEDSLSEIAEKISDDENLDQILAEEERSGSQSKDGFEEISSEEEYEDDGNADNDLLMDYSDYELSAYVDFGAFNPFQCEFTSLQTLKDPSLSLFDIPELENTFDSEIQSKVIELVKVFANQRNDKWVEAVEQISVDIHKTLIKDKLVIKTLIDFIVDGIDFDLAMKQTNTAYKVRHLKAGIKLLITLAQTSDEILKQLIDLKLTHTLLQLYNQPYMTIPVRLLIIRGIDVLCDSPSGVEHLFTEKYKWSSDTTESSEQTCYQRLLDILVEKPSTRLVVSLTCLLKKMHLLEVIKYVSKTSDEINDETCNEDSIAVCLNEISMTYKNANQVLSQPLRSLPATKQFELKTSPFDSYKAIYKYFKRHNIVECLTNIISGKTTCSSDTFDSVLDLLNSMSNFTHGLRFLLSCDTISSTNNLHKVLIQQCDDSESQVQNIGLKLIYRLQALQLVDMIFSFHSTHERSKSPITKDNFDDPDLVATLHSLYTMLFTGIGRDAVVHVLSSENNFDSILPFICADGDKRKEERLVPKSVSCGCALELCSVTLQLIDTNLIGFLDTYGQTLLKICENESILKLQNLSIWLSPIKNVCYNVYNENTFKNLMSIIRKHYESIRDSTDSAPFTISPDLITALRILQNLCSPTDLLSSEAEIQLKHRYALIQIYSLDGLTQIVFLLNKMSETYLKPSHQSVALIGSQGSFVVNFIKPCVLIIKSILTYLVSSRGTDFKDVSPIPVLLRVYSVLALVPTSVSTQLLNASIAQQIQYEISEILLIYTELYISATESDEAINKSVWTKMAKHIIDYTLTSPLSFFHGLTLLSDLLPQPLPLLVKQPMLSHEITKTVNFRKLWSLHLHVLNEHIEALISSFITSNSQPIQLLLKRVCVQLCDLSAPTVNIVSKSIFESLLRSLETFNYSTNDSRNVIICPTVRVLNFIQDLSTNTPFRIGFLDILGNGIKKETKYSNILSRIQLVLNKSIQTNSHESLKFILSPESDVLSSDGMTVNTIESNKTENITNESSVANTETLGEYFSNRPVFVLEDDRLVADWVSVPNDDSEQLDFSDAIKIDLIEVSAKYFGPEFDIRANLVKLWSEENPRINETQTKENDVSDRTSMPFIRNAPKDSTLNMNLNKRIQAPRGRGRVFTRINDPFRSRPPNTSRPPSMHVDDFVALERNDTNSKRINKEFIRPNRGMNTSLRSFGANQRSSNANNYRPQPSNARNISDRYNSRDVHSLSSNRVNKSDSNFPLRWNRIGNNRYDIRYSSQYSRSFPRS